MILTALFIIKIIQKQAKAENKIKIYPSNYIIGFKSELEWQNIENAFSQDLSDNASLIDFNESNSAFIKGNITEDTNTTTIETTTTTIETTTSISEPITNSSSENTTAPVSEETTTTLQQNNSVTIIPHDTTTTLSSDTTTTLSPDTTTTFPPDTTTTLPSDTTTTTPPEPTTTIPSDAPTTEPITFFKKIFSFFVSKVNAEETNLEEQNNNNQSVTTIETIPVSTTESISVSSTSTETLLGATTTESNKSVLGTTTTDSLINQNSIVQSSLIFNNFNITEDFNLSLIQNVQLRFSFAGQGKEGDKIIIRYYYHDQWYELDKLDLSSEISNNTNGGYFLYSLPVFNNYQDLQNFWVEFKYEGSKNAKVYLDSVWLEITYTEDAPPDINFLQKSKLSHQLNIDKHPNFACAVQDFNVNLKEGETKAVKVTLYKKDLAEYLVSLGDMPSGVKAYFTENGDSVIRGQNLDNNLLLYLIANNKTQKGSFNIPIIFSKKIGNTYFDNICQFNLVIE
jgi:hypothetical protein